MDLSEATLKVILEDQDSQTNPVNLSAMDPDFFRGLKPNQMILIVKAGLPANQVLSFSDEEAEWLTKIFYFRYKAPALKLLRQGLVTVADLQSRGLHGWTEDKFDAMMNAETFFNDIPKDRNLHDVKLKTLKLLSHDQQNKFVQPKLDFTLFELSKWVELLQSLLDNSLKKSYILASIVQVITRDNRQCLKAFSYPELFEYLSNQDFKQLAEAQVQFLPTIFAVWLIREFATLHALGDKRKIDLQLMDVFERSHEIFDNASRQYDAIAKPTKDFSEARDNYSDETSLECFKVGPNREFLTYENNYIKGRLFRFKENRLTKWWVETETLNFSRKTY